MACTLDRIADAVVARLEAGAAAERFALTIEPERVDVVDFNLTDGGLRVQVVGLDQELARNRKRNADDDARDLDAIDYTVEVTVLKKQHSAWTPKQIADLKLLVEQIFHYLRSAAGDLSQAGLNVEFCDSAIKPLYDHGRLREQKLFASQQKIIYRGWHDLGSEDVL